MKDRFIFGDGPKNPLATLGRLVKHSIFREEHGYAAPGAVVVRCGQPGFGGNAGVAESKLKKVEERCSRSEFFSGMLRLCWTSGVTADRPSTENNSLFCGVAGGASRQQPLEVIAAVM